MLPEALPYQQKVRDHFKQQAPVWEFFAAAGIHDELEITDRIISAIADHPNSDPAYAETARRFKLSTFPDTALDLHRLDIFDQATLYSLTRDILLELLRPQELRTPAALALAHRYFPDLIWTAPVDTPEPASPAPADNPVAEPLTIRQRLTAVLTSAQPNIHDYFSCLLQDFAHADPSLEGRTREFTQEIGL